MNWVLQGTSTRFQENAAEEMKILVLTSSYPRYEGDGAAPFVKSIANAMAEKGHTVDVVAPYDLEVKPAQPSKVQVTRFKYIWPRQLHLMGHARSLRADVSLHPLSYILLPFYLLSAFIVLLKKTVKQQFDCLYVHWVLPNGPAATLVSWLRGIPLVVSLHGSDVFIAQKNGLFALVARWVFQQASGVTACSPELYQAAVKLKAKDKIKLIPWGANPDRFHPQPDKAVSLRKQYGLPQDRILVASLGRFVPKKGFQILIKAMAEVVKKNPQTHLVIGGDGPLRETCLSLAAEAGIRDHSTFPGKIPWTEVPDFLAAADIFVQPSIRDQAGNLDGLPTVILEAMSCGLPVIASSLGGIPLVINQDVNGLLVDPGDVKCLAAAIMELVSQGEKRETLGRTARKAVVEAYNWDQVTDQILKMIPLPAG